MNVDYQYKLHTNGFCHLKNVISNENISYGKNYINDKVNYTKLNK